jgi:hypothetical protein
MNQYTFEDVKKMTFEQLGAIDDPWLLIATGLTSPMLLRYVVRTGQLETRYAGATLPNVLQALDRAAAATHGGWPFDVSQKAPLAVCDADVDKYLDALDTTRPVKELKA